MIVLVVSDEEVTLAGGEMLEVVLFEGGRMLEVVLFEGRVLVLG